MYVYGPVPSRRLGNSLGVSTIPSKACSYSCVYCQIGRTDKFTVTRQSFFPKEKIFREIKAAISNSAVDYITFVGDGEPTLSADLGWFLAECKKQFSIPTAVITNGSLIYRPDVAEELQQADLILPSIDAGTEDCFRKINRPHKALNFQRIIQKLIDFSNHYSGQIRTETMLVKNFNDNIEEIDKINTIIKQIEPEKSYILVPTRPPQEAIEKPSPKALLYAQKVIYNSTAINFHEAGNFNIDKYETLLEAIQNISSRHPLRLEQAEKIASTFDDSIDELIQKQAIFQKQFDGDNYILPKRFKD